MESLRSELFRVDIAIDNGIVNCTPGIIKARRGDRIQWVVEENRPFTAYFGVNSPLEEESYSGGGLQKTPPEVVIPERAPLGKHEYLVALFDEASRRVLIEDPDLIIRR